MQAGTRLEFDVVRGADVLQATEVIERETEAIDRSLEQQQQAIGAIDQAATPFVLQLQHETVMGAEQLGGGAIAKPLDHGGRIDQVGQKRSDEHTSELQSLMRISYAVFCLKTKK